MLLSGGVSGGAVGTVGISGTSGWVICSLSPGAWVSGSRLQLSGQFLQMVSGQSSLCVRGYLCEREFQLDSGCHGNQHILEVGGTEDRHGQVHFKRIFFDPTGI